jgi:hypothetical protein
MASVEVEGGWWKGRQLDPAAKEGEGEDGVMRNRTLRGSLNHILRGTGETWTQKVLRNALVKL